jgi:hypothetical protein
MRDRMVRMQDDEGPEKKTATHEPSMCVDINIQVDIVPVVYGAVPLSLLIRDRFPDEKVDITHIYTYG